MYRQTDMTNDIQNSASGRLKSETLKLSAAWHMPGNRPMCMNESWKYTLKNVMGNRLYDRHHDLT
jgi:hypothetical protein